MRPRAIWDFWYRVAKVIQFVFGIFGMVLPISEKVPVDKTQQYFPPLAPLLGWAQDNLWWATPGCLLVAGFATVLMKWIGEPWAWQMASSLITGFRNQIFKSKKDPVHRKRPR
jgi:hypothetical protein